MSSYLSRLREDFERVLKCANGSDAVKRLAEGRVTVKHYAAVMRQIFHQARENPQLQAFATMYFHGRQREMVAPFLKHAAQEIGHDQLALDDLRALDLDIDVDEVPFESPLPATTALTAFAYYTISRGNPIGYLGYLYFLEHMPTASGGQYIALFTRVGVPESAFSFIREHVTVDHAHNRLMERYVEALVRDESDYQAMRHAMEVTGYLYAQMVSLAFGAADLAEPVQAAPLECARR